MKSLVDSVVGLVNTGRIPISTLHKPFTKSRPFHHHKCFHTISASCIAAAELGPRQTLQASCERFTLYISQETINIRNMELEICWQIFWQARSPGHFLLEQIRIDDTGPVHPLREIQTSPEKLITSSLRDLPYSTKCDEMPSSQNGQCALVASRQPTSAQAIHNRPNSCDQYKKHEKKTASMLTEKLLVGGEQRTAKSQSCKHTTIDTPPGNPPLPFHLRSSQTWKQEKPLQGMTGFATHLSQVFLEIPDCPLGCLIAPRSELSPNR